MSSEADPRLARLKRLPVRLRIAHLAALLRVNSYPSSRERERVVGREGRSAAQARLGDILLYPHPAHRSPPLTMIHPPRKGEGSERDRSRGERSTDGRTE